MEGPGYFCFQCFTFYALRLQASYLNLFYMHAILSLSLAASRLSLVVNVFSIYLLLNVCLLCRIYTKTR